jgi:hypothetical protein
VHFCTLIAHYLYILTTLILSLFIGSSLGNEPVCSNFMVCREIGCEDMNQTDLAWVGFTGGLK